VNWQDAVVGGVAIALAAALVLAAALDSAWFFSLRKSNWLATRFGRGRARLILAAVGLALAILGVAIMLGWAPNA